MQLRVREPPEPGGAPPQGAEPGAARGGPARGGGDAVRLHGRALALSPPGQRAREALPGRCAKPRNPQGYFGSTKGGRKRVSTIFIDKNSV